jgi:hypothetical protein
VKQTVQKGSDRQKAAAANIAVQRRKLAVAGILFFVMAVLWVKVFVSKSGPKAAQAVGDSNRAGVIAATAAKVIYTELPVVAGRHDVLATDFFSAQDFRGFRKQGETAAASEVSMSSSPDQRLSGDLAAAVEELELTAIVNDKKPQAFIGDRLLEKGQSFRFMFNDQTYVFKVVNIMENGVELECNGIIITKKIPELLFKTE